MRETSKTSESNEPSRGVAVYGNVTVTSGDFIGRDQYVGYTAEQVTLLLDQIRREFQPKPFDGKCPYVGLDPFYEDDADRFFGREALVAQLVERATFARFIVVAGPSGSGKSSLVRAGLIPALKGRKAIKAVLPPGGLPAGSGHWLYAMLTPGLHPIESLADAMARAAKSPEAGEYLRKNGEANPLALHRTAESLLTDRRDQRALVFIDQFEETFTQVSSEGERRTFLDLLTSAATREDGRVVVVLTMRSDFISNCASYPQLNALLNRQFFQVSAMQPEELARAIAMPAIQAGLQIDPDLVSQVIDDMQGEPGALPLMQFALEDLFKARQAEGGAIALTRADYLARGGVKSSLARHAEAEFARLNEVDQKLALDVFTSLVKVNRAEGDTRRTVSFDDLVPRGADRGRIERVVQALSTARLLTTSSEVKTRTVTLAHEKLIDAWPRLRQLVDQNREALRLHSEIAGDAENWRANQRDASYLYRGRQLDAVQAQLDVGNLALAGVAQEFVSTSIKQRQNEQRARRRRLQVLIGGLTAIALVMAGLAGVAINRASEAEAQTRLSRSREWAARAVSEMAGFPERALLLAIEANTNPNVTRTVEAEDALRQALQAWRGIGVLRGHTGAVNTARFSPDGARIVSASDDGTARVWDVKSRQEILQLRGHTDWVTSAEYSPDGTRILTSSKDKTARLWDANTGQELRTIATHTDGVNKAHFDAQGKRVVTASSDQTACVWNVETGEKIVCVEAAGAINDAVFVTLPISLSDGDAKITIEDAILTGDDNNKARLWDLTKPDEPIREYEHDGAVMRVAVNDGEYFSTASRDGFVRMFSFNNPDVRVITSHSNGAQSVDASGSEIVSAGRDQTVRLWDSPPHWSNEIAVLVGHAANVNDASLSPARDAILIASASDDHDLRLWMLDLLLSGARISANPVYVFDVGRDGRIAVSGDGQGTLGLFDIARGQVLKYFPGDSAMRAAKLLKDGVTVFDAFANGELALQRLDLQTFDFGKTTKWKHPGALHAAQVSNDETRVITAGEDKTARIWDLATQKELKRLNHPDAVLDTSWSPDGARVVTAGRDRIARVWDAATGNVVFELNGHTDKVLTSQYSPDGKMIVTGSGDQTAVLWDAATGKPLHNLYGHLGAVLRAKFSPDSQSVATASADGIVRVWNTKTGQLTATLRGHTGEVYDVDFTDDGSELFSAGADGTVRRHILSFDRLLALAKARVTRELVCDEKRQLLGESLPCPQGTPAPTPKP